MVRRLFWVTLGATAGVLVVRQLTKTARNLTPGGLADRAGNLTNGVRDAVKDFIQDVRDGATQREYELRFALGVEGPDAARSPDQALGEADERVARAIEGRHADGHADGKPPRR
jgi:hypothetical protein